jgi:hypothetical protein
MTDARHFLQSLMGKPLRTITGRENRILSVARESVSVATTRSPRGQEVPVRWVQDAIDRLERKGEIEISVESVGYRSAFIGAVLQELPGGRRRSQLPTENQTQGTLVRGTEPSKGGVAETTDPVPPPYRLTDLRRTPA